MARCEDCGLPGAQSATGEADRDRTLCRPCLGLVEREPSIHVAPLSRADLELVLAWRSNPEIYGHFRDQDGPLDWEEHVEWFESRGEDRHDFVVHYGGRRVGVVGIGEDEEVVVYLGDVSARGRGVATAAVTWLCERFAGRGPLTAEVHAENDPSRRLFQRCGFREAGADPPWVRYVYSP